MRLQAVRHPACRDAPGHIELLSLARGTDQHGNPVLVFSLEFIAYSAEEFSARLAADFPGVDVQVRDALFVLTNK